MKGMNRIIAFMVGVLALASLSTLARADDFATGKKAYSVGAYGQALTYLTKASKQYPKDPSVQFALGLAQARSHQFDAAKASFVTVTQLVPPTDPMAQKARNNAAFMTRQQLGQAVAETGKGASSARASQNIALLKKAEAANKQAPSATNYLSHIIDNGQVVQWSAQKMPLKIYVAPPPRTGLKPLVQQACQEWAAASQGKLRFTVVDTPKQADIRLAWTGAMSKDRLGVSPFQSVGRTIVQADVVVALQLPNGQPLATADVYPTILHELGHALGMQGHSPYPEDIMFFSVNGNQPGHLTGRDKKTLGLLYAMTPDVTNDGATGSVAQNRRGYVAADKVRALFKQNQFDQAAQLALASLNQSPDHPELLYLAGASYHNLGQIEQAKQFYQRALRADPTHEGARINLNNLQQS
jgi:tetratricopeptide (TPR) repeat protein